MKIWNKNQNSSVWESELNLREIATWSQNEKKSAVSAWVQQETYKNLWTQKYPPTYSQIEEM